MVVRFSDRLEIRDLPPPPSSSSSSSVHSVITPSSVEPLWRRARRDNNNSTGYSQREHRYLPPPAPRRSFSPMAAEPVHLRADSLLMTSSGIASPPPPHRTSQEARYSAYDPVADDPMQPSYLHQQLQPDRPVLQQTAAMNWALPPGYYQQARQTLATTNALIRIPEKKSRIQLLGESWLFLTCVRTACLLLTLSAIFACAFSQYWTEKAPVVLGMVFSVLSAMVMGAAVAVIFVWDMPTMNLAKRILFTLLFSIMSLTAAVLYTVGVSVCSSYNQYGCFVTNMSPALKVAAAFSYIALAISLLDCGLTFYFYRFDPAARAAEGTANVGDHKPDGRPPLPAPIHTEV
ncbi:hypothetical protein PRIPAC_89782 [Pristionchus pacificus]|uniref:Uncharacterized protein n=1 Tax=Pristionchus pacificus TaxID=54126 RepID=A0A2A6B8I2_PRIPA|nr:hypothetical protein PRIPAC_89782 [Pristionchus pacificus]|eukprot:PDM62192.1 hypothetical protein PRIPAC_51634 [Pristionchus pacificus]